VPTCLLRGTEQQPFREGADFGSNHAMPVPETPPRLEAFVAADHGLCLKQNERKGGGQPSSACA